MPEPRSQSIGRVYLVGAGPGDPGLIAIRGVECLRRADLVLYDYLVNPQILEHAAPGARAECLGRHGRDRIVPQAEINRRMVEAALAGLTVVRLKGGDPAVFARAAEETQCLAAAGIPFEVVPGITAALAAGSYAGISLTHRDLASAVALVTGHEQSNKQQPALDYGALAAFPGTLVFYMGVTSADVWAPALLAGGKPPSTPVAVVRRCSWPDQSTFRCSLGELVAQLHARRVRPPALVIVGEAAADEPERWWFTDRPLFGQRVLVTRPTGQADALRRLLSDAGADTLLQPAIEIGPAPETEPLDQALTRLATYDWIVFSSANGVHSFLKRLFASADARGLHGARLAAIGPGTADALREYHLRPDLVPAEFRAEALAAELAGQAAGSRFLLVRASRGREVLAEQLRAAGADVEQVVAYQSIDAPAPSAEVAQELAAGRIDWVTVTSSAIATSLARLFGENLRRAKLASISPITSATLVGLGFAPAVEARVYTIPGLVQAMIDGAKPPA